MKDAADPETIPTVDELVRRAEGLHDALTARAAETERLRMVHPDTMADLHRLGLLKYFQPRQHGGYDMPWGTQFHIGRALAKACASTAWIATVVGTHAAYAARMKPAAHAEIWGATHDVLVSTGSGGRNVTVNPVEGGIRLSGQWSFLSGIDHANWAMVRGGPDDAKTMTRDYYILPKGDYTIVDDWFVTGMRGTGSKSIRADNVFVPAHRTCNIGALMGWNPPGAAAVQNYVVSYDFKLFGGTAMLGAILGCAEAAVADHVADMKRAAQSGAAIAADINAQLRMAESMAEVRAAALLMEGVIAGVHAWGARGQAMPRAEAVHSLSDRTIAVKLCVAAVERIGLNADQHDQFAETPFQRRRRDLAGMAQQIGVNWDRNMSSCAQAELGLKSAVAHFNNTE
jgi:3-hydroxy-9,10-secoandrosta-1,3,5(10)-triene-9,17-dione monooxygenase